VEENCVRRCSEDEETHRRVRVRYAEGFESRLEDRNFITHLGLLYDAVEVSMQAQDPQ